MGNWINIDSETKKTVVLGYLGFFVCFLISIWESISTCQGVKNELEYTVEV